MTTKIALFGITGDLAKRKLLPALEKIISSGQFDDVEIIGISRRPVDVIDLLGKTSALTDILRVYQMNLARADDYVELKTDLDIGSNDQILLYLSVPPLAVLPIIRFLGQSGITGPQVKLLLEKPFGVDLDSAREVVAQTADYFDERQVYRIDHYLAKEMAQNIVTFRAQNALLENIWHTGVVERIDIVATETLDIEGRGQFYEQTGALRDIVQGHLMQLLALVLMELPPDNDWDNVPACRRAALAAIKPAVPASAIRGQYRGYQQDANNVGSMVETLAIVPLQSLDTRWQDVDIRLITGKALSEKTTEIRLYLHGSGDRPRNRIVLRIQPNEGVEIDLVTKTPGYDRAFDTQKLAFSYQPNALLPDAYEQVIVDAIRSQKSLFTSSEEILESWRVLQPLLDAWAMDDDGLVEYDKGVAMQSLDV